MRRLSSINKTALGLLLFIIAAVLFLYTFLHEAGHALVGLAFGQTLTTFDVRFWNFNPHVSLSGSLTTTQRLLQIGAGTWLPLLIWFLLMAALPRRSSFSVNLFKAASALMVLNTLLAWMIIPILDLAGRAPAGDDVTNFLRVSEMPPLLLSALALMVYGAGWVLLAAKVENLKEIWRTFRQPEQAGQRAGMRAFVFALSGTLIAAVIFTLIVEGQTANTAASPPAPPDGYRQVAEVDLPAGPYEDEPVAEFVVETAAFLGVFFVVREIDTTYIHFFLQGPDGFSAPLLRGEGYRTSTGSSHWHEIVPPGRYRLLLTADQSPGTITIYTGHP